MRKFAHIALGLLASLGIVMGLAACDFGPRACNVSIAQFAVIRGIDYLPNNRVPGYSISGRTLTQADLGPVFDFINTSVGGCTPAPAQGNYSSYLAQGTQLYTIKGYQPSFRLAVKQAGAGSNQSIVILEAESNPHASKGSDMMTLDNKVSSILLYPQSSSSSSPTTPPLASASSPQKVAQLVALFDQAPVKTISNTGSASDLLVFRFSDGTLSSFSYDPTTGWTVRGVVLPSTFASLLTAKGK